MIPTGSASRAGPTACTVAAAWRVRRRAPQHVGALGLWARRDWPARSRSASSASTPRPVRIMSIARLCPTIRGSAHRAAVDQRHAPPSAEHAHDRVLLDDAHVAPQRQLQATRDRVPADRGDHRLGQHHPARAHRTGTGAMHRVGIRCAERLEIGSGTECSVVAPEHGDGAESSLSNSSNASYNSAAAGPLTALRASGRFMITVVTGPLRSTRTPPLVTLPPSVRHRRAARPVPRRSSCRPSARRRQASRRAAVQRAAPGR